MECREAQPLLIDLLYGELAAESVEVLERHLGSCAQCREEHALLRSGKQHLSMLPEVEPDLRFVFSHPETVSWKNRVRDALGSLGAVPRWAAAFLLPIVLVYGLVLATGARIEISRKSIAVGATPSTSSSAVTPVASESNIPSADQVSMESSDDRRMVIEEMVRRMRPEDRQVLAHALLGYYESRAEGETVEGQSSDWPSGLSEGTRSEAGSPYRRARIAY